MTDTLITDAEVGGRRLDVLIVSGRIAALAEQISPVGRAVVAARGGMLVPGLHDHHIHLAALAARRESVLVGPPAVHTRDELIRALRVAPVRPDGWVRAVGYHESVAGELSADAVDQIVGDRPVRIQHRSGAAWILNTAGLSAVGMIDAPPGAERDHRGHLTGRLFGLDDWLRDRLPGHPADLGAVGRELASYGITGVTDMTPTDRIADFDLIASAVHDGLLPFSVAVTGAPVLAGQGWPGLAVGPVKLLLADHALMGIDELLAAVMQARRHGRAVAVHSVTRASLLLALAVWDELGVWPGDRVEHGSVIGVEEADRLAGHGITVVTQPNFIAERGDAYRVEVDPDDRGDLYRCGSLLERSIPVAGGTDAPFGHPDPWRAMRAAVERRTARAALLGPNEAITPGRALALFLGPLSDPGGPSRTVEVGAPADLCLLGVPSSVALRELDADSVVATWRCGVPTFVRL